MTDPWHIDALAADLARGLPTGEAVARFNASEPAQRIGTRMCLFGDPDTRSALEGPETSVSDVLGPRPLTARPDGGNGSRAAGLGARIHSALLDGRAETNDDHWRAELAARALDCKGIHQIWLNGTAQSLAECDKPCPCASRRRPLKTIRAKVLGANSARKLSLCPHCAIARDAPDGNDLNLDVEFGESLRLIGTLPTKDWHIAYRIRSAKAEFGGVWPADQQGKPYKLLRPRYNWPNWDIRVDVCAVIGEELVYLVRRGRRDA